MKKNTSKWKPIFFGFLILTLMVSSVFAFYYQSKVQELASIRDKYRVLVSSIATPRYPDAIVSFPGGSSQIMGTHSNSYYVPSPGFRNHFISQSSDNGNFSFFYRFLTSDRKRDIYEFIVFPKGITSAEPDEQSPNTLLFYVSFRGEKTVVFDQNGFSIAIKPNRKIERKDIGLNETQR